MKSPNETRKSKWKSFHDLVKGFTKVLHVVHQNNVVGMAKNNWVWQELQDRETFRMSHWGLHPVLALFVFQSLPL